MAERVTISLPEDLIEDFDHILDVKEMRGEIDSDSRSPAIAELIEDYIAENREDLRRWEVMAEGNLIRRATIPAN